jgi:hypothetical protein
MNPEQLHILQHSLGLDQYAQGKSYRNRYVCDPQPNIDELVALGLMADRGPQPIADGMHCYQVTEAGMAAMYDASPLPPKRTRGQKRYDEFLRADLGMTFGEYLKTYHGKEQTEDYLRDVGV